MSEALLTTVLDRHRKRRRKVRHITIDMDPTADAAHGQQEFAFYNGHYGNWCYLPMPCFVSFDKESEQYLVAVALCSGTAAARQGVTGILLRVVGGLCVRFLKTRIRIRLDGCIGWPDIFEFLKQPASISRRNGPEHGVGASIQEADGHGTAAIAREWSKRDLLSLARLSTPQDLWEKQRRQVMYKVEVVRLEAREPRDNCRFAVTNLSLTLENVYKLYRQRGDVENRIKELKDGLGTVLISV